MLQLDSISIVLVDTKTSDNIGAAARCMMNMGLVRLALVRPPADFLQKASKLAAGSDTILEQAKIFSSLKDAVADCGLVLGTSRHKGRLRKNILAPQDAAREVISILSPNRAAVVFGNEVNGLTREDIACCHELISIPSTDRFPSLNLSHAVMIIAYELFRAAQELHPLSTPELATSEATDAFYLQLQKTLLDVGFLERDHPERMMLTIRQIFGRARLSKRDVSVLRGILTAVDRVVRPAKLK